MLRTLRFFENLFFSLGSWFEDLADSMDKDFHEELRQALSMPPTRGLSANHPATLCPICGIPDKEHVVFDDGSLECPLSKSVAGDREN